MKSHIYKTDLENENLRLLLLKLGRKGAKKAATALSSMINNEVTIDVPRVHIVSPLDMPSILKPHDLQTVVIIEQLSQNLECDLLLVFRIDEANELVRSFLDSSGLDDISERDVMCEVGNILIGNFLTSFSDYAEVPLKPTPPKHLVDYFEAILDNYVTSLLFENKQATLFDTTMNCLGNKIRALILMFIGNDFKNILLKEKLDYV